MSVLCTEVPDVVFGESCPLNLKNFTAICSTLHEHIRTILLYIYIHFFCVGGVGDRIPRTRPPTIIIINYLSEERGILSHLLRIYIYNFFLGKDHNLLLCCVGCDP